MADTAIQWTDKTWNPTTGCTRVSAGCKNCYAFELHDMRHAAHKAGKDVPKQYAKPFTELQMFDERVNDPKSWRKPCRVFVNSMSDLFHKDVPDQFIDSVFRTMIDCPRHTFQILTKRPERMQKYVGARWGQHYGKEYPPPANVWLGVSVENRKALDEREPLLIQTPAAVRFLSCEPLLGPLEFSNVTKRSDCVQQLGKPALNGIHWVIVGGESGHGCRPCNPQWVRSIVNQCKVVGVPVFVKQMGGNIVTRNDMIEDAFNDGESGWPDPNVEHNIHGYREEYQGADCRVRLRDKKGGNPSEWPADLRVREFPRMEAN